MSGSIVSLARAQYATLSSMRGVTSIVLCSLAALAGCSGTRSPEPPANLPAEPTGSAVGPERRCLPVVSSQCGCSYPCAVGERAPDGGWRVRHEPIWKDAVLEGKIVPWCVDGACTDAFDVELVCDGICAPKAADPKCRFVGTRCVGSETP